MNGRSFAVSCRLQVVLAVAAWSMAAARSTAADPPGQPFAVQFVLSAGRTMGESMGDGDGDRLDVARTVLLEALADLAAVREARVGLVLYGHRLAWRGEGDEIDDNANYLAQTDGFAGINMLLPGDDVESLRGVAAIDATGVAMLRASLEALEPFGEAPLYRAIQVAEASVTVSRAERQGVVVLTDGATAAERAMRPGTLATALAASDRHGAAVHVVAIGGDSAASDLEELARGSGGTFHRCPSLGDARRAVADAVMLIADGDDDAPVGGGQAEGGRGRAAISTVSNPGSGEGQAKEAAKTTRVTGRVLYARQPVAKAKVSIPGVEGAATTSDAEGRFAFNKVPPGTHELVVEGIAKNVIREGRAKLVLEPPVPAKKSVEIVLP